MRIRTHPAPTTKPQPERSMSWSILCMLPYHVHPSGSHPAVGLISTSPAESHSDRRGTGATAMRKYSSPPCRAPGDGSFPPLPPATKKKKKPITFRCRPVNKINLPLKERGGLHGGIFFFFLFQRLNTNQKATDSGTLAPLSFRDTVGDTWLYFSPFFHPLPKFPLIFRGCYEFIPVITRQCHPTGSAAGSYLHRCLLWTLQRKLFLSLQ